MEILCKRLTDDWGDVWILLYEEGCLKKPLGLFRDFQARALLASLQHHLSEGKAGSESGTIDPSNLEKG